MSFERQKILAKPVWQGLASHQATQAMPLENLRALDEFFEHMARHSLETVAAGDFLAFARLTKGAASLNALRGGLVAFDPADPSILVLDEVLAQVCEAEASRTHPSVRRNYTRVVSVSVSQLPTEWQCHLEDWRVRRATGDKTAPATAILDRLSQKLCQYIFCVRQAGLVEELHLAGAKEFYQWLTQRESVRSGEPLRPATIRASFEELERFARLTGGYSEELCKTLGGTLEELRVIEAGTSQLKYTKLPEIGSPADVVRRAFSDLAGASAGLSPVKRHQKRNQAAALALPAILPLRRDWDRLVFGKTLVWRDGRYRLQNFKPGKTQLLPGRKNFPGSIHPKMTPFVDALILQDNEPKYLDTLRAHAEKTNRPLFRHANGDTCAKNYVSYIWSQVLGVGATISRTLVHEHFGAKGEDGLLKALMLCDQYSPSTARQYTAQSVHRWRTDAAQVEIAEIFQELDYA